MIKGYLKKPGRSLGTEQLLKQRYDRFRKFGEFVEKTQIEKV